MQTRGRPGSHPLKTFAAKLSNQVMRGGVRKARVRRFEERSRGVPQTHAGAVTALEAPRGAEAPRAPGKWARTLIVEPSCVLRFGLREPCPGTTSRSRNGESPRCLPPPMPWAAPPSTLPLVDSSHSSPGQSPASTPGSPHSLRSGSS